MSDKMTAQARAENIVKTIAPLFQLPEQVQIFIAAQIQEAERDALGIEYARMGGKGEMTPDTMMHDLLTYRYDWPREIFEKKVRDLIAFYLIEQNKVSMAKIDELTKRIVELETRSNMLPRGYGD